MKKFLALIVLSITVSCGDQKIDTTQARKEMEDREIKVVSDAEIIERAMDIGKSIAESFAVEMVVDPATQTSQVSTSFGPDSLYKKNRYFFSQPEGLNGKPLQIFEAYLYNQKNGIPSEPNLQKLDDGKLLYYTTPMISAGVILGMWSIEIPRKSVVLSINN